MPRPASTMGDTPKVSVSVTTYDHGPFVADALDGILMQRTDFEFEVIIGDDCSSDSTREVIREYVRRDPQRVNALLPPKNLGGMGKRMFAETLALCRGEYIAFLDGDDFWTAPDKLQRQVEYLEAHPGCSMCFHNVEEVDVTGSVPPRYHNPVDQPVITGLSDILARCYIAACSPLFRREALVPLPDWYLDVRWGDWPLYIRAAQQGAIGYLPEVMAVRRLHAAGMWSRLSEIERLEGVLAFYRELERYLGRRHRAAVRRAAGPYAYQLARCYARTGDRPNARVAAWRALRAGAPRDRHTMRRMVQMLLGWPSSLPSGGG